jgi:peptidoglycan hydrolase-like protein with peptidoglycan-binding domain
LLSRSYTDSPALRLGFNADGIFDGETEAAVRAFQRNAALVPDGIIGPATWHALNVAGT